MGVHGCSGSRIRFIEVFIPKHRDVFNENTSRHTLGCGVLPLKNNEHLSSVLLYLRRDVVNLRSIVERSLQRASPRSTEIRYSNNSGPMQRFPTPQCFSEEGIEKPVKTHRGRRIDPPRYVPLKLRQYGRDGPSNNNGETSNKERDHLALVRIRSVRVSHYDQLFHRLINASTNDRQSSRFHCVDKFPNNAI